MKDMAYRFLFIILSLSSFFYSCTIPFSDFQTANLVGKGKAEVIPFYTNYVWGGYHYGLNLDVGLTPWMDVRAGYSVLEMPEINITEDMVSLAPKFNLKKNELALTIPVLSDLKGELVTVQPTLLVSKLVTSNLNLTLTPKLILIANPTDNLVDQPLFAMNLGLSYQIKGTPISIRPEMGFATELKSFLQSDYWSMGFGLGLAFRLGRK